MPRITPIQVAMGVGVSGAMTDVSTYADLEEGITRTWGRRTEFDDVPPGTFSFTLDNADGRFTPGNTASPLSTTVTEGMSVAWNLGGRLVAGTIQSIEPQFPHGESAWSQVQITCDDQLGNAGRREIGLLVDAINNGATTYMLWPFDDTADTIYPRETANAGSNLLVLNTDDGSAFGAVGAVSEATELNLRDSLTVPAGTAWPTFPFAYPTSTLGFYSFWITPGSGSRVTCSVGISGLARTFQFGYDSGTYFVRDGDTTDVFAWTGVANASSSTRTNSAGVVTNQAKNPSFETATTGYSVRTATGGVYAPTLTTTAANVGSSALRITATTASAGPTVFDVNPFAALVTGDSYYYSVRVRPSFTATIRPRLVVFTAGSGGGVASNVDGSDVVCNAGEWTTLTMSGTLGASILSVIPAIRPGGVAETFPLAATIDVDGVLLSKDSNTTYFDGSFTAGVGATWASDPDGLPHFVSVGLGTVFSVGNWTITATLYVDGVSRGSTVYGSSVASLTYRAPVAVSLIAPV